MNLMCTCIRVQAHQELHILCLLLSVTNAASSSDIIIGFSNDVIIGFSNDVIIGFSNDVIIGFSNDVC